MAFIKEPSRYEKTILSDLQGAWIILRDSVAEYAGFEGWDRVLFHVDEAMSWEVVRNLRLMPSLIIIIRNLCIQGKAPKEIIDYVDDINEILSETLKQYPK